MCTNVYQNRLGFVEDMTKTFWCVFSVHSVHVYMYTVSQKMFTFKVSQDSTHQKSLKLVNF